MEHVKERLGLSVAIIILMAIFLLPWKVLDKLPDFPFKNVISAQDYHLWLDLKWWTHLDYRVDLSQIQKYNSDNDLKNDVDIKELVEWVRTTLEKRVNNLWVSEPNIYISKSADEYHIIVELAWITDIEEAKKIVWKTIQLEFKELIWKSEDDVKKEKGLIKTKSESIYNELKDSVDFTEAWKQVAEKSDWSILFTNENREKSALPEGLSKIWDYNEWQVFFSNDEIKDWAVNNDWIVVPKIWYSIIKIWKKSNALWIEKLSYDQVFISTNISIWKNTWLDWSHFKRAQVVFNQAQTPLISIEFDSEWTKLFWDITSRNVWKPVAIFVWWNLISSPVVNEKILWWSAQITWQFSLQDAVKLKSDLNTWAIWAPIVLSWQHQIEASIWADSLNRSINAWLWWVFILIIFMIHQYRFLWIIASLALLSYSIILLFVLKESWYIWTPIVLTLAWIAWIILSIWMAVDANILIFERMKEELKSWKNLMSAISIWFSRAWPSIRDSNSSSLITCAILIWFWTSMIRWFAINLSIWIIISLFTAITMTRSILYIILPKVIHKIKNIV